MSGDETTQTVLPARRPSLERWFVRVLCTAGACPGSPPILLEGEQAIGRSSSCAISLADDRRMSRRHAEIRVDGAIATIVDSSANGTFVNGRLIESAVLADGDVFRVGESFLIARRCVADVAAERPSGPLLGDSPAMVELRRTLRLVGPSSASVLVVGETGTGKELVAQELHRASHPQGPFVPVNCSAIPATLAEASLFGHTKGAFSGADSAQPGYFRAASAGVLFLDEVGELPVELQPKLLRALEDDHVTPVGSTRPVPFDARVLAATNRDLRAAVGGGMFRADLYARLAELTVTTPPLRERREDILPILMAELGPGATLTAELVDALLLHGWPFNVRELVKLAGELRLRGQHADTLGLELVGHRLEPLPTAAPAAPVELCRPSASGGAAGTPSKAELKQLLRAHGGVVADVARAIGRSRKQIYRWLHRYDLDLDDFRGGHG